MYGYKLRWKRKNIDIVIRPEDIIIDKVDKGFFNVTVINTTFKGNLWEIIVKTSKGREWIIDTIDEYKVRRKVSIKWKYESIHVMWKEVE